MSTRRPRVSIINSNDEIVMSLRMLFEDEGFFVSTGHVFDFKTGKSDLIDFLKLWDPQAIVFDIAPPYASNWQFFEQIRALDILKGRGVVVTTTNRKELVKIAGPGVHPIEILGKPEDMGDILAAIKRALARHEAA